LGGTTPAPPGSCSADVLPTSSVPSSRSDNVLAVLGAVLMIVVMVLVVPVAIMFGGAIWSALFGWVSSDDADRRHQGDAA
jgi:cytochrome b subunit of formate dehydrogenase